MNETERERIMRLLAEGALRPDEAAQLLAAMAEGESAAVPKPPTASEKAREKEKEKLKGKEKPKLMEVQMQRPDGTHYTVEVPPSLVPMIMKMAGVAIRESARTATRDAWDGLKTIVRNKTEEVKTTVREKINRPESAKAEPEPVVTPEQEQQAEARRRILQMVQNGRISAGDAGRLIQQLDALQKFRESQSNAEAA